MPNYRNKNKKTKNKNRQKNQQQNQNKTQNQNQNQNQQSNQNRQQRNKDNQNQGQSRQEQRNQQQLSQSPKSSTLPSATNNEPQSTQQPLSSDDALEVDSTTTVTTFNQCYNCQLDQPNSSVPSAAAPTRNRQANAATVEREECNRVEDAGAQITKLDNKEVAETAESEGITGSEIQSAESTMGNRDSKTSAASNEPTVAMAPTTAITMTSTPNCDDVIRPDCTIADTRDLDGLLRTPKTQMAKVIVHRLVRETSEEGEQKDGYIDKVRQTISNGKIRKHSLEVADGQNNVLTNEVAKMQTTTNDEQIISGANSVTPTENVELRNRAVQPEVGQKSQQSNRTIHQIDREESKVSGEGVESLANEATAESSKVIIHPISREEIMKVDAVKEEAKKQTAQKLKSNLMPSSEGSKFITHQITANESKNAQTATPRHFHSSKTKESESTRSLPEQLSGDAKVLIHHIHLEASSPVNYRVELPEADSPTSPIHMPIQTVHHKNVVQIQEISDESSTEYNDNPPVVSEAESETESTSGARSLEYIEDVRALSPDSLENYDVVSKELEPRNQENDLKQRRAQKRVALETHFLPQLLSPRFLDSIIEENSDMSDARSDCSDHRLMNSRSGDDLRDLSVAKVRKANETFPRSNLDFSRRHAKKQQGALPKTTISIREEPPAMVVAAKLVEAAIPAQECCTRLSSEHTPESEAAEVIYLSSSASSSLSDLLELDAEGDGDDERDSCLSTVDLDTDARQIITKPASNEQATASTASDSRETTPVNQTSSALLEKGEMQKGSANNNRSKEEQMATATIGTATTIAEIINPIESRIYENLKNLQLLALPSDERVLSDGVDAATIARECAATVSESDSEMSSEATTERCGYLRSSETGGSSSSLTSSIETKFPLATTATSDSLNADPTVLLENIEFEMNSVREILNSHKIETQTTCGNDVETRSTQFNINDINSAKKASPSPPPIPPPPTNTSSSDVTDFQAQLSSASVPASAPPIPTRDPHDCSYFSTHTSVQANPLTATAFPASPSVTTLHPINTCSSTNSSTPSLCLLARQESAESHCSDSTQHSQSTAINVGSHNELTPPATATSPISDNWKETNEDVCTSTYISGGIIGESGEKNDASIKKLRLLCTETLASMPYGEEVLEELATVAQNIGELQAKSRTSPTENSFATQKVNVAMPYPLPQLPHISDLQLSITDGSAHDPSQPSSTMQRSQPIGATHTNTHTAAIKQLGDQEHITTHSDLTTAKQHSPPPPPIPAPPSHYSDTPWLGVPTAADPKVLVCLSPAQQHQLAASSQQQQSPSQQQPDQLLDAHQKFLERRGYHEFSEEQVMALNAELQLEEQQILKTAAYMKKLRKSLTPPPPPVPPPPVPSKSSETAAKAQSQTRTSSTTPMVTASNQRLYDTKSYINASEQTAATFTNGEEQQQQLNQPQPTLIHNANEAAEPFSVVGSSSHLQASSLENNSEQLSAAINAAAAADVNAAAEQSNAPPLERKQPTADVHTPQYSNVNASESTSVRTFDSHGGNYANSSFPSSSGKMQGVESELAKMFPTMGANNIFDSSRKRFSNIESSTSSSGGTYCVQLQSTLPKRYSNIETHSYETNKHVENGQVIYDYTDSRHERQSDGDESLANAAKSSLLQFPVKMPSKENIADISNKYYPVAGDCVSSGNVNGEIMSEIKLNTTKSDTTTSAESKEKHMPNFECHGANMNGVTTSACSSHTVDQSFSSTRDIAKPTKALAENTITVDHTKNRQENSGTARQGSSGGGSTYEEFRQRAKAATSTFDVFGEAPATAPPFEGSKQSAFNFQQDKLFKDFDALSQQLHKELEKGRVQREQREKSASLYDLSRPQWNFKDHFDQLKKQRHEHMQELEREIERSMRSRQLKGWSNSGNSAADTQNAGRIYEIPIHLEQENGCPTTQAPASPRSYNIPIQMEKNVASKVAASQYDTVDNGSSFRRAESMCNLSNKSACPQPQVQQKQEEQASATYNQPERSVDDWERYASDFGLSENITRPLAREVEICYQRQRPRTIRAPRLSASTSDLTTNSQFYDSYKAYDVHRTHALMLQTVAQQQRPHHSSCYSVLERDPNPTYISTTSRRGVSPAPVSSVSQQTAQNAHPHPRAPERQRRASLPREIQEEQLKYITTKEEELRAEFERLQSERRRLMDELNGTPQTLHMPQHPMRDVYRPVPKLPTLSEDEVFRQQMAEEWLNKVAEREERRLHKIIKISKVHETQQGQQPPVPPHPKTDISEEFLKRVQERRSKLAMPADSDWESGAESQPVGQGHISESDAEVPPVKVIEGKAEADLRNLPRHLREFARFSNHNTEKIDGGHRVVHEEEERRQEASGNSMSSAVKKSSTVKTVKIATNTEMVNQSNQRMSQQQRGTPVTAGHGRPTGGGAIEQARPQNKSSTGYQSEPEPNYDSDYSTVKYRTLDRRRLQSVSSATNVANRTNTNSYQHDKVYGTMPNPIKSTQGTYKNQPGRIEDYVTGRSSVSEKERKEWWDEVMDIFNGHLDQAKLSPHYTEGNLSRALTKESGYTSDSNLVFRKREAPPASPLSPVEQKLAYKSVQAGGEPPLFGFRKPAPERPKDDDNHPPVPPKPSGHCAESPNRYVESDVNIHFKTPVRHEYKPGMSDEELAQRQAEQMQKLYQEERRRKYLQELQDMNARRHTDNFTPTQKSPIPLNRYDDFQTDLAPKSPNTITTRTAARALYSFQGQNARELSFKKGDIIYIRRQIDRNWFEGEHNAMIGLLPVSYVEVISKEPTRQQPKKPSEGQARAKYNFQAQSGIELSLNKGELITLTRRVDENWFEGKIANRKGIFPVSYVEVLTDIGAEDIAARTVITEQASVTNLRPSLDTLRTNINNEFNLITKNGHQPPNGILKEAKAHHKIDALHVDTHSDPLIYRALYKYRPQNSDEMELLEGDIVHVLEICDDGWFVGTSQRTGCFGTFPGNYVERVL